MKSRRVSAAFVGRIRIPMGRTVVFARAVGVIRRPHPSASFVGLIRIPTNELVG